jgi:hypothetical protein
MKSKKLFSLPLVLLGFILVGCNGSTLTVPIPAFTPTILPLVTKTSIPSTVTPTPTIEITPSSAATQISTQAFIPTFEVSYGKSKFLALYHTNGNCQLPCWWGIVPGKTTLEEVKSQFAPYGELVAFEEYQDKAIIFYPSPNDSIDYNISSIIKFNESGTITSISLDAETLMYSGFTPTYLLTNIGKPSRVEISPSRITMLYDKQNVFAAYDITLNPETNQLCFLGYNALELWSSEVDNTSSRAKNQNDDKNVQAFYDAFKTWKGSDTCFLFQ